MKAEMQTGTEILSGKGLTKVFGFGVNKTVAVHIETRINICGRFDLPGQFEGIENIHPAVLVDIFSLSFAQR